MRKMTDSLQKAVLPIWPSLSETDNLSMAEPNDTSSPTAKNEMVNETIGPFP